MRDPITPLSATTASINISFYFFRDREVPPDQSGSLDPVVIQYVPHNLFVFFLFFFRFYCRRSLLCCTQSEITHLPLLGTSRGQRKSRRDGRWPILECFPVHTGVVLFWDVCRKKQSQCLLSGFWILKKCLPVFGSLSVGSNIILHYSI